MSHVWQIVLGCVLRSPEVHMCTPPPSGALRWKHLQALPYVKTPRGLGLAYRILWSSTFSRMRSKSSLLVTYTPCFLCLFLWQERLFLLFFFKIYMYFLCGPFLKSLLNLLLYCFCCYYILDFWPQGMWDPSSPTRDRICTPCIGRWNHNHYQGSHKTRS